MFVEDVELTMSNLGLGNLNEYALMVLFGNAHSHHLTLGTGINPGEIKDANGDVLYPAYFYTLLKVSTANLLRNYKLWDDVSVGVEVKRFGDTLLESDYVLGPLGKVSDQMSQWNDGEFPRMHGNNLIVVDGHRTKRKVSNPESRYIADLEKVIQPPVGIMNSKKVRRYGFEDDLNEVQFSSEDPLSYKILDGRDTSDGHAMIFAKFSEIMDFAELSFLSEELSQPIPNNILANACVLEREIYYYGNCYAGEVIDIRLKGNFESVSDDEEFEGLDYIPAAYLKLSFEISQKKDNTLLAMGRVKKIIAVPMKDQELVLDVYRISQQFSQEIQYE